jgi:hypothetical protein
MPFSRKHARLAWSRDKKGPADEGGAECSTERPRGRETVRLIGVPTSSRDVLGAGTILADEDRWVA